MSITFLIITRLVKEYCNLGREIITRGGRLQLVEGGLYFGGHGYGGDDLVMPFLMITRFVKGYCNLGREVITRGRGLQLGRGVIPLKMEVISV